MVVIVYVLRDFVTIFLLVIFNILMLVHIKASFTKKHKMAISKLVLRIKAENSNLTTAKVTTSSSSSLKTKELRISIMMVVSCTCFVMGHLPMDAYYILVSAGFTGNAVNTLIRWAIFLFYSFASLTFFEYYASNKRFRKKANALLRKIACQKQS